MKLSSGLSGNKTLVIVLTGVALVLSIALIYVQTNVLLNLRAETLEEEAALDLARDRLNRYTVHKQNAADYERRLAYAEKMIPPQPGEEFILRYLHYLADEYALRVAEIRFDSRVEEEEFTALPLTVTLEGGYPGLGRLLGHLRDSPERALRVDDVRISRGGESDALLRVVLSGSAFYNPTD